MSTVPVRLTVNGEQHEVEVEPRLLLVHLLRDTLGLTGTHVGCDTTNCGACTVHLDGEAVKSCTVLAVQADGAEVKTIEGMADGDTLHPLQEAFWNDHGLQCGYCTPGMIMAAADLLARNPDPSEAEVRKGLEGNLCRCTGYHNIVKAVLDAAKAGKSARRAAGGVGMSATEATATTGNGHVGRSLRRKEDPRLITGPGLLRRRHQPHRPAVGGLGALARGAREDRLHRHLGGEGARRRRRGLHPRGPRHGGGPADGVGPARRRRQHARPLGPGQGRGQARRRPRRARHRQRPLRGRRRGRGRHRRLRPAAGRHRPRGGARGRLAARPRRSSAPTRCASGRWAAATSRPASPRPTTSSSAASSTTASPARRSSRAPCSPISAPTG